MLIAMNDLAYLRAASESLKDYLLSNELFWTLNLGSMPGQPSSPKLTLGNLRLAQARLGAHRAAGTLEPDQESDLVHLERKIETLRAKWRSAWEEKAGREFVSRLRQWGHYLDEVGDKPERHAVYYPSEVRLRVLLEVLQGDLGAEPPAEVGLLPHLDARLRGVFKQGDFTWSPGLAGGFPEGMFWFLYGGIEPLRGH